MCYDQSVCPSSLSKDRYPNNLGHCLEGTRDHLWITMWVLWIITSLPSELDVELTMHLGVKLSRIGQGPRRSCIYVDQQPMASIIVLDMLCF